MYFVFYLGTVAQPGFGGRVGTESLGDGSPPAGSRGRVRVEVCGPQKPYTACYPLPILIQKLFELVHMS